MGQMASCKYLVELGSGWRRTLHIPRGGHIKCRDARKESEQSHETEAVRKHCTRLILEKSEKQRKCSLVSRRKRHQSNKITPEDCSRRRQSVTEARVKAVVQRYLRCRWKVPTRQLPDPQNSLGSSGSPKPFRPLVSPSSYTQLYHASHRQPTLCRSGVTTGTFVAFKSYTCKRRCW